MVHQGDRKRPRESRVDLEPNRGGHPPAGKLRLKPKAPYIRRRQSKLLKSEDNGGCIRRDEQHAFFFEIYSAIAPIFWDRSCKFSDFEVITSRLQHFRIERAL